MRDMLNPSYNKTRMSREYRFNGSQNSTYKFLLKNYYNIIHKHCNIRLVTKNSITKYKILYDYENLFKELVATIEKDSPDNLHYKRLKKMDLNVFYKRDPFGNIEYYSKKQQQVDFDSFADKTNKPLFSFKGKDVLFKITDLSTFEQEDAMNVAVASRFINAVIRKLEEKLNEKNEYSDFDEVA
jgi:hypothetical protein